MYIWSKFEDSTLRGYSKTELNATGENVLRTHSKAHAHADAHEGYCISQSLLRKVRLKRMLKMHKPLISIQRPLLVKCL